MLCVYKSTRYAKEPDNLIALIETSVKAKREEGSPFADPTLDKLVGHSVKAKGLATSGILIMRNWKTTD